MAEQVKIPVSDTSSQVVSVPNYFHLANLNQLTNSLHGDGFFPFKGNSVIDGVSRPVKELNGEVVPGTGKQVKIRSYAAIIDGILLTDKNTEKINLNVFSTLNLTLSGTVHIVACSKLALDGDGVARKEAGEALFKESAVLPAIDSGSILVATLTGVPASGQITAAMINNSVKDYLLDIDNLSASLSDRIAAARAEALSNLVDAVSALRAEISQGDSQVVAALDARVALAETQIAANALSIVGLQDALAQTDLDVADLRAVVNQNVLDIVGLRNSVDANAIDIAAVSSQVSSNTADISLLQSVASLLSSDLSALTDRVGAQELSVTDLSNALNALVLDVAAIQSLVNVNSSEISGLHSLVAANLDAINDLSYRIDTQALDIDAINTQLGVVGSAVSALQSALQQAELDIVAVNAAISALSSDLSALGDLLTQTVSSVDSLSDSLNSLNSYVSSTIAPRIDQVSDDLSQAVLDLTQTISSQDALLQAGIQENTDEITSLQAAVSAPTTGLTDRVIELENRPPYPVGLDARVSAIESRLAILEAQEPLFKSDLVELSDVDENSSDYGLQNGDFVLPAWVSTTFLEDNFNQASEIPDVNKWEVNYGIVKVLNNQLVKRDPSGVSGDVNSKLAVPANFEIVCDGTSATNGGSQSAVPISVVTHWNSVSRNWEYHVHLVVYPLADGTPVNPRLGIIRGGYISGRPWAALADNIYFSPSLLEGTSTHTGITVRNFSAQFKNGVITVKIGNNVIAQVTDPLGPYNVASKLCFLQFGRKFESVDNVKITDPVVGTYNLNGTVITKKLESVDPIKHLGVSIKDSVPANTSLTYEVSLNGGTNFVPVTNGDLLDGTEAPWNGSGNDVRLKVTLASTSAAVSPVVKAVALSTSVL